MAEYFKPMTTTTYIDRRDQSEMIEYQEARIEALRRRIAELEAENEALKHRPEVRELK